MKKILIGYSTICLFILSLLCSCKENDKHSQSNQNGFMPTSSYYKPSKLLDSLTKVFLDSSTCKDCTNEIFIDKVTIKETYITFRSITHNDKYFDNYLNKRNPIFYFTKNNQKFFVSTGIEDYVTGDQEYSKKLSFSEKDKTTIEMELFIQFKIFEDSIHMLRVAGAPFMPEMNQDPLPLDDSITSFDPTKDYSK